MIQYRANKALLGTDMKPSAALMTTYMAIEEKLAQT